MHIISKEKDFYTLRFDRGDHFPSLFQNFLEKEKIIGGWFMGLGAFQNPEISYYDLRKKIYLRKKRKGLFEVLNLIGNVATLSGKLVTHTHVVLSGRDHKAFGGHLFDGRVGGTLEISFTKRNGLHRKLNTAIGLPLLQ